MMMIDVLQKISEKQQRYSDLKIEVQKCGLIELLWLLLLLVPLVPFLEV